MPRSTTAHISLPAIEHNLVIAKQHAPDAFLWAVTKADAYGHGLTAIYQALVKADGIAVLEINKAIELRQKGEQRPILLLEGAFDLQDTQHIAQYHLTPVLHQYQQIEWLRKTDFLAPIRVYLKVNTGMNRLGFPIEDFEKIVQLLSSQAHIKEIILMTHFANADEPQGVIAPLKQLATLNWKGKISFANSAALLGWSDYHKQAGQPADAVRPGISLYGSSPFRTVSAHKLGLQATMSLEAEIISIQSIKKGESIGYGGLFTAQQDMTIGIVACGYADGYPRYASTGTPVWVNNSFSQLLGRVSMDMCAIELTHLPNAQIGHVVELWGTHVSIDTVAEHAHTIAYELMCGITPRVKKIYHTAPYIL